MAFDQQKLQHLPTFSLKKASAQRVLLEALGMLDAFGVPLGGMTPRRLERMAMAFLAVCDVTATAGWAKATDVTSGRSVTTRAIISYVNEHFAESISSGSYDDIRRQDLRLPVEAGIVARSAPSAATNSPTRGYALSPAYLAAVRAFGTDTWEQELQEVLAARGTLAAQLAGARQLTRTSIQVGDQSLEFGPGDHNALIKAVIEQFLPRFGQNAEVLYVGDADNRDLLYRRDRLDELKFAELTHGELPDVVAYSPERNWLFLVEAVHTSGPLDSVRKLHLETLAEHVQAGLVFVTAFRTRDKFRAFSARLAWETEVWIEEDPDHLIHFNGDRFLGPHST